MSESDTDHSTDPNKTFDTPEASPAPPAETPSGEALLTGPGSNEPATITMPELTPTDGVQVTNPPVEPISADIPAPTDVEVPTEQNDPEKTFVMPEKQIVVAHDEIKVPKAMKDEPHAVTDVVREHFTTRLDAAIESMPLEIRNDASAVIAWVKRHF